MVVIPTQGTERRNQGEQFSKLDYDENESVLREEKRVFLPKTTAKRNRSAKTKKKIKGKRKKKYDERKEIHV